MSIFEPKKMHLNALSPNDAVDMVRKLVWAEATASNIPKSSIDISQEINTPDGGIDGIIVDSKFDSRNDIIKKGRTCYQIKSGNFALEDGSIDDILLKEDGTVKDRIKSCLDEDGTLVIVFTKWDAPERENDQHKDRFLDRLKNIDQKYANAKISIWHQNTIIGCMRDYPSLCLDITGLDTQLQTHEEWSTLDDMKPGTHFGDEQHKFVDGVRQQLLRKDGQPIHVRVVGDPGIGKTRLVLEATRHNELSPLVLYAEDPSRLESMNFIKHITSEDSESHIVLVVDECDSSSQTNIWNKIKYKSPSIRLVTIFNEPDESAGTTIYLEAPPLNDKQIAKIFAGYGVPDRHIGRWVERCKPSPRMAHMVGQNLTESPDDIFKQPDTVRVWDRCIASQADLDSDEFKNRKRVLCWLALFKRFGFEQPFDKEAELIAEKIEKHHCIGRGNFNEIIKKLKKMKILQGHRTLYITPKILHIKMWTEWWNNYGNPPLLSREELIGTPNLLKWYQSMFEYAQESKDAGLVVKKILDGSRALGTGGMLSTESNADFFLTLATADPKKALEFLNREIGKMDTVELKGLVTGRRQIVLALGMIARKADHFADSARLLLALAEAENEGWANNATGTFVGLFSSGSYEIAPTELPPLLRLDVIREALESSSSDRRMLAIRACSVALETRTSSLFIMYEDWMSDDFKSWHPKSSSEVTDYYTAVLKILESVLDGSCKDEKRAAASTILERARGLLRGFPDAVETVIGLLQKIRGNGCTDEQIIEKTTEIIEFDGDHIDGYVVVMLKNIMDDIVGNDYHSLMRRHVAMGVFMDQSVRKEDHTKEIENLAKQSLDANLLREELSWLVTAEAKNGGEFGRALGMADKGFQFIRTILEAQTDEDDASDFMCGYFSAIFKQDLKRWESEIDRMGEDDKLCRFIPDVIRWSGVTERAGRLIITLIRNHSLDFTAIERFQHGNAIKIMPESVFAEWMEILRSKDEPQAAIVALDLFYTYYVHKNSEKTLPRNMALDILFHEDVVSNQYAGPPGKGMVEYYWKATCMMLVKQHPDAGTVVAESMLERFSNDSLFSPSSQVLEVLDHVAVQDPSGLWRIASRYISPPADKRAFFVTKWLRGGLFKSGPAGILAKVPLEGVFAWIDEDVQVRAPYVAGFIPPKFEIAKEMVKKYGAVDGVGSGLVSNFLSEGWSGPGSQHYREKKDEFVALRNQEDDMTVKKWLDHYIDVLDKHMLESESWEERNEF